MDIKRAKQEIKDSIEAYLAKDEFGHYLIPAIRQRPILLMEAMKKAIQNPTEDTIFELSSTVEANAFKAGVRSCLQMMHCLFIEE